MIETFFLWIGYVIVGVFGIAFAIALLPVTMFVAGVVIGNYLGWHLLATLAMSLVLCSGGVVVHKLISEGME